MQAWIPHSHPSASLLYIFDGSTHELLDETFRTWGPSSVGYGSDALIFGPQVSASCTTCDAHAHLSSCEPQFANLRAVPAWKRSLALVSAALQARAA